MTTQQKIEKIKKKFGEMNVEFQIPLLIGNNSFTAKMIPEGIWVSNLGENPVLVWAVFEKAIDLLISNGIGVPVMKGDAMKPRLDDPELPLDSIEGAVAHQVYSKQPQDVVFRRISPIVGILRWAEIATNGKGVLILNDHR